MIFLQMKVRPKAILIDCSELELGRNLGQRRGRPDDNLEAYKRRLQHYREHCLPMLKALVWNILLDEVDRFLPAAIVIPSISQKISSNWRASISTNQNLANFLVKLNSLAEWGPGAKFDNLPKTGFFVLDISYVTGRAGQVENCGRRCWTDTAAKRIDTMHSKVNGDTSHSSAKKW